MDATGDLPHAKNPQKTVVMIHGAGGGGWEYRSWQEVFESRKWCVFAPDLMPNKDGIVQTRLEDYVSQLADLCKKNKLKKPVFVGASMGGILALKMAEQVPASAVVLVNSVPPKGISDWHKKKDLTAIPDVMEWSKGSLQESRDAMPDSDEDTILWAHKRWRDESGKVLRTLREGVSVNILPTPTLVIIGEKDDGILPDVSRAVAKHFGADVVEYQGMSHVGPLLGKKSKEVATLVLSWLEFRT